MKKHTKITALALAIVMMLAMLISASGLEIFIIASSDEYKDYTTSAKYLETISVLKGYDDGQLHLEEPILRYQAALFFARIVTGVTDESAWGTGASSTFTDVPEYGPIMDLIASMNIIRGYGDGRFGYDAKIMYQDMCAMLVRVLGYETDEMIKTYPMSYILKVEKLGLGLKNVKGTDYLNRGQTAQMVYNALTTEIAQTSSAKDQALIDLITQIKGDDAAGDATKDTYLERNFDVSSRMTFTVVATENYALSGYEKAEEGYITMVTGDDEEWTFPVEGGPTNGVTEADLINKRFVIVFNDKEPTNAKLDKEDIEVIFAEMIEPDVYENLGELNFVKYDDEKKTLTLNKTVVKFGDASVAAPTILKYNENKNSVFDTVEYDALVGDTGLLETDTYFRFEAYDYDDDGVYDELVYIPYSFGQYAVRTYKDSSAAGKSAAYTMVGTYSATPVYDVTGGTAKTTANRTNFIERFLGTNATASGSTTNYTPGDTSLTVSKANGELSKTVEVQGVEIKSGEFMIYSYNKLTNKLYVAANLGTLKTGTLSGERTTAQAVVIDGSVVGVGVLGVMDAGTGILSGTDAYSSVRDTIQAILADYEKDETNVRYLEYDGKIAYLEAFADSDNLLCADYKIVDIEKTMSDHEKSLSSSEEAWDIGFDGNNAVLKVYNPDTAAFEEIKVESLTVAESSDKTYDFKNAKERYDLGSWTKNKAYDLFKANGALYVFEDDDNDGYLELYAVGTEKFEGIVGAPVVQATGTNPDVYFSYGKSNKFVDTNYVGISTERFASGEATVAVVIGTDGYSAVKGTFGTNGDDENNELYLSVNAQVLRSDSQALVIYDPAGTVTPGVATNVYKDAADSVWRTGKLNNNEGIGYYLFGAASKYVESRALLDADGNLVKDDDGKRLYEHEYKNLINLETFKNENVTIVSTDATPVVTEVENNANSVIRIDAEHNAVSKTSFGEVFVENGDYRYGGFSWLATKDKIGFVTLPKDGKPAQKLYYDSDNDLQYQALKSLNVTFIDLDAGADVSYKDYSFADAYVFHQVTDDNLKAYASVDLEDVTLPNGTFALKRHVQNGSDVTDIITNGSITKMTGGKFGLISTHHWFRWNGWSDYLIPAVDENYDTIWTYAGSLRVHVTYYAYINYDEKAESVDAIVVRVGEIVGVVGEGEDLPEIKDPELDAPTFEIAKDYVCGNCGWVYNEGVGYSEGGIDPWTKWEDVPEDFTCPDCHSGKADFSEGNA